MEIEALKEREVRGREGALLGNGPERRRGSQRQKLGQASGQSLQDTILGTSEHMSGRAFSPQEDHIKSLTTPEVIQDIPESSPSQFMFAASLQLVGAMPDCSFVTLHSVYF